MSWERYLFSQAYKTLSNRKLFFPAIEVYQHAFLMLLSAWLATQMSLYMMVLTTSIRENSLLTIPQSNFQSRQKAKGKEKSAHRAPVFSYITLGDSLMEQSSIQATTVENLLILLSAWDRSFEDGTRVLYSLKKVKKQL